MAQKVKLLKLFVCIILLQYGYEGMSRASKFAINQEKLAAAVIAIVLDRFLNIYFCSQKVWLLHFICGEMNMANQTYSILWDEKTSSKMMTWSFVLIKIMLLGLVELGSLTFRVRTCVYYHYHGISVNIVLINVYSFRPRVIYQNLFLYWDEV